ncbi:MAG: hypothetical protein M0R77_00520 [Gammaproteobacteria bacterium]|nr:hypothetical protein [Acholeplasmataceae bacterium]MCK9529038.1 hypothetical protein [Gammaproteobacteria bacterium]
MENKEVDQKEVIDEFIPHPLVQTVNEYLKENELPPIARVSEDGIEVNTDITDSQARLAINRDIRRRLVKIELEKDISTYGTRSLLYNDGLNETWLGSLKLDVIPVLIENK